MKDPSRSKPEEIIYTNPITTSTLGAGTADHPAAPDGTKPGGRGVARR